MRKIKFFYYMIVIMIIAELVLRLVGIRPFPHFDDHETLGKVEKHFNGYMCNHKEIGIIPCQSIERVIYQSDKIPFKISHLEDGSRFCGYSDTSKSIFLITGDSNTHGDGVNDSDHVGFLLQKELAGYHVINRSIPGSGNISQLLVLRNSLKTYRPELVLATYGSYHNPRNIFSRSIKKLFRIPMSKRDTFLFPFGSIVDGNLQVDFEPYHYTPVPFSDKSSIMEGINRLLEKKEYISRKADDVTLKIWDEYIQLCTINKVKLLVLVLTDDAVTKNFTTYLTSKKIDFMTVNFPDGQTFKPIDSHPNSLGHFYLTQQLLRKVNALKWVKN